MPLTRCDVPSPLVVSSERSILSHASMMNTPWEMFLDNATPVWDSPAFEGTVRVNFRNVCF